MQAVREQGRRRDADDAQVHLALEPEQFVAARRGQYGRRHLSRGALAAMWGLRIYAILMVLIVLYSVIQVMHSS